MKSIKRFLSWAIGILLTAAFMYFILAFILGVIPLNTDYSPAPEGIEIFVSSNGVHLDFVVPVQTELIDWQTLVPLGHFPQINYSVDFIGFGWGEKNFYINTPEWKDLTAKTAVTAMLWPTEGAMHVSYYKNAPVADKNTIPLVVSAEEYQKLIQYIQSYFRRREEAIILIPGAGYSYRDNFYEAHGKYHLFFTSNSWVNKGLRKTGIRTAVWAPFDKAIIYQVDQIRKERKAR